MTTRPRLLLGVESIDITPAWAMDLCGFVSRDGHWDGIRSRLRADVFVFGGDADDGPLPRSVLVAADLVWWGPDVAPGLRKQVADALDIPTEAVLLHATHTHGGPVTSKMHSPSIGRADDAYIANLIVQIVDAAIVAAGVLQPVTVRRGSSVSGIGVNRRRVNADGSVAGPDPLGPIDREVTTVQFMRPDGSMSALLVHFTCHPSSSSDNAISADFVGAMRDYVSHAIGESIPIGYLQGCCGDIRVDLVEEGAFREGTTFDINRLGGDLGESVLAAMVVGVPIDVSAVQGTEKLIDLRLAAPDVRELHASIEATGIVGEWSRRLSADPGRTGDSIALRMCLLDFGHELSILGFDAEVAVEFGLFVKLRTGRSTLPIGYSNGMIGYLVTEEQLRLGGYEPAESYRYIYRAGPFHPSVEGDVKAGIDAILARPRVMS